MVRMQKATILNSSPYYSRQLLWNLKIESSDNRTGSPKKLTKFLLSPCALSGSSSNEVTDGNLTDTMENSSDVYCISMAITAEFIQSYG